MSRSRAIVLLYAFLSLSIAPDALAEEGLGLALPGARVRLSLVQEGRMIATYLGTRGDTIVVSRVEGAPSLGIPSASVTRFEVSAGCGSSAGRGLRTGLLLGLVGGVVTGLAVAGAEGLDNRGGFRSAFVVALGAGGALGGMGIGALAGAFIPRERWVVIPTP